MHIGFITRWDAASHWGGDLAVVNGLIRGLTSIGHKATAATSPFSMPDADMFFLTNSTDDQRKNLEELELLHKPFNVLGFHEDLLLYYSAATGMRNFIFMCLGYDLPLNNNLRDDSDYDIDMLFELPHIIHYYGKVLKRCTLYNHHLIRKAKLWVANSVTEARTMQRDCPGCKTAVVPVAPGMVTSFKDQPDDSFLKYTGLSSGNYLLQVGRLQLRKNQLGTILASKDLDIPLVFIATRAFSPDYEEACFKAAAHFRKAPTLFISENLRDLKMNAARVLFMPNDKKLPASMLISAYHHAGLHIHPAFQELPGATYLEAARLGTPSIASSWTTIDDYFYDKSLGHAQLDGRILYTPPHHLKEIKQAIEQLFGKRFPPLENHPALQRTEAEAAQDLIDAVSTRVSS
ncbi:MAG: hypothetical protein KGZ39_00635 [Simkania sp.]|nr:hypothetical protein [Simkania sp.]